MVFHIVIWDFQQEIPEPRRQQLRETIQTGLEGLKGVVKGLRELSVVTQPLPSSNGDLLLWSVFSSRQALQDYQQHPAHLEVASLIREVTCNRRCFDYKI